MIINSKVIGAEVLVPATLEHTKTRHKLRLREKFSILNSLNYSNPKMAECQTYGKMTAHLYVFVLNGAIVRYFYRTFGYILLKVDDCTILLQHISAIMIRWRSSIDTRTYV